MTPQIAAQTRVAKIVVIHALRLTMFPAGAERGVPGTTAPASSCDTKRSGNTTKNTMNQETA